MLRRFMAGWLLLSITFARAQAEAIPDRPEKLNFPPLVYTPPQPESFRLQLKTGPIAYLVPDRELPLVTITILVRAGAYLEPPQKEGVADFTGHLLVRGGTAGRTAEALEERLAFLAASLNSAVGDDAGSVNLNLLSKDLTEGLAILREVLTTPRFQSDKVDLYREQTIQAMRQRNDDSSSIEAREYEYLAFGTNFWATRNSTEASVTNLTIDDLKAFHRKWFHPGNFVVAASGDFERNEMIAKLEALFGNWPFQGEIPPPIPTNSVMAKPGLYLVEKDVNQGRVAVMLPGVRRDDPNYPAILVMNDILGGGGFTSRIMNRVRSDEGLAYGASSGFPGGVYYPLPFHAGFQSKSRTVAFATSIVLEEMKRIAEKTVSDEELNTAKRSFIDTFPQAFNTKTKTAAQFARDEFTGRFKVQPNYWNTWRSRIESVTKDDVLRVAQQYLHPDKAVILVVGKKEEILKGHPDHPVSLPALVNGSVTEIPLRDPLTLEPIQKASSTR
jgi:predicted Zn-dependent peptidase